MTKRHHHRFTANLFAALLCAWFAPDAGAQFFPQPGGGGFPGGTTGGRTGGSGTRTYPNNTQVGEATITSDRERRKLIVVTDEDTNLQIKQILSNLDRPQPQVLIKVVFLEVTYSKGSDIGLEGGWRKQIGNSTTGAAVNAFGLSGLSGASTGIVNNVFGQNITSFTPTPPGAGLYQMLGQDYQVTLRAIAQSGSAEVISRPSILARNSQPATITVGQSVPLITSVRYDNFGNAQNGVTYTDVGVILKVTPFITQDGLVEMILAPELSSLSDTKGVPIAAGVTAPILDKRSADTVVVTPDGQTVIIGGLMGRTKSQSESKIRVLGDIPLLGAFFKRKIKADAKSELLIFLTPHIVQAPSQLSALSASEREKNPLPNTQFSEKELNEFLDTLPVKKTDDGKGGRK